MDISIDMEGIRLNGQPTFLLGTSYLQPESSVNMWTQDSLYETTDRDFARIAAMGMNTVKLFLFWGAFYPDPAGPLSEKALGLLDQVIACAKKHRLYLIIDLMVGHMSGENYDVPWREGRDLMKDPYMLRREAEYIERLVSRYREEESILIWDVCNEISLYRIGRDGRTKEHPGLYSLTSLGYLGDPPTVEESYIWLQNLTNACRKGDPNHPAYTGVGTAMGFPVRDTALLSDLYACYVYPDGAAHKSSYRAGFETALAGADRVPCLIEEFGATKTWVSPRYEAHFYRMVLYSSLMHGSVGALSWLYSDFDGLMEDITCPYLYHAWETHFGMVRADGTEYPCAQVVREFADFLSSGVLNGFTLRKPDVYLLVGEYYDEPHAFNSAGMQTEKGVLFEAYCRLSRAGLRPAFLREYDPDFAKAPAICIPCRGGEKLKASTWNKLWSYLRKGGKLLLSGTSGNAGPYCDEFFGVEKYADFPLDSPTLEIREDFHGLRQGEALIFPGRKSYIKLDKVSGAVVAAAGEEPLMVTGRCGEGKTVLFPFALEESDSGPEGRELLHRLYQAALSHLEVQPPVSYSASDTELALWEKEDQSSSVVLLLNHSFLEKGEGDLILSAIPEKVTDLETGRSLSFEERGEKAALPLSLEIAGVRKLMITWKTKA